MSSSSRSETAGPPPTARPGNGRRPGAARPPAPGRWQRRLGALLIGLGVLLVLALAYLAVTALLARNQLQSVRADLTRLRTEITAGDVTGAQVTAQDLQQHTSRAHQLTTGPVWAPAAAVPGVGAPLASVRGLTAATDQLAAGTVPALVDLSGRLDPQTIRHGSTIDVQAIADAAPTVHRALEQVSVSSARVDGLPTHTWLGAVDSARTDVATSLHRFTGTLSGLDRAVRVAPGMLGADGPRRYFVGFINESESRGLGGLPGAFAIAVADHGRITFPHFESDLALDGVTSGLTAADIAPDYASRIGAQQSLDLYVDSTLDPNFPYVARIWAAMWERKSGEHIDGAITLDPTALSYFLRVTGPATLPDGTTVGADTVVDSTQRELYARFATDNAARKQYLIDVARAVETKVLGGGGGNSTQLVKAAARAASERRLLLWTSDPAEQAELAATPWAGQLPSGPQPFTGFTVDNAAGNKLDYYLDRDLRYERGGCGATRSATVTITLKNDAPATGLTPYVTARLDQPTGPVQVGDTAVLVNLYATRGATLAGATLDGVPVALGGGTSLGHPVFAVGVELPRGKARTLVVRLTEPAVDGPVTVLRQPLVRPLGVQVDSRGCTR